jgi:hypothetical protein
MKNDKEGKLYKEQRCGCTRGWELGKSLIPQLRMTTTCTTEQDETFTGHEDLNTTEMIYITI